jgi:hypothetical protein
MLVRRTASFDYDPAVMYLSFRDPAAERVDRVQELISAWMGNRGVACDCTRKLLIVQKDGRTPSRVRVLIQWVCRRCLDRLVSRLADTFGSQLTEIVLGADESD